MLSERGAIDSRATSQSASVLKSVDKSQQSSFFMSFLFGIVFSFIFFTILHCSFFIYVLHYFYENFMGNLSKYQIKIGRKLYGVFNGFNTSAVVIGLLNAFNSLSDSKNPRKF